MWQIMPSLDENFERKRADCNLNVWEKTDYLVMYYYLLIFYIRYVVQQYYVPTRYYLHVVLNVVIVANQALSTIYQQLLQRRNSTNYQANIFYVSYIIPDMI